MPPEILKFHPDWWAPPLAALFTTINKSGIIPKAWTNAIIVPVFKKGDSTLPENYRPISLLSVLGKLYAKQLLNKLLKWISENKILGPEQIGFCAGKSTLDHCVTLTHLVNKYSKKNRTKLFVGFLDLKGAFDSIPRDLLWDKLADLNIDKRLLYLIRKLYSCTSCQVRLTSQGKLTSKITINKGVKQGCILAPFLFNLFLNDLAPSLHAIDGHCPKLGSLHIPLLLYADDAVVMSCSRVGLKRLLNQCLVYCESNRLTLNYGKSKVLVFAKSWKPFSWNIQGNIIEQVRHFKYLGVHFHYNASWTVHRKYITNTARNSAQAIARFFYTKGNQFVPAALKVFNAKTCSQLLYGIPIWISAFNRVAESIQSVFLRRILGIPNCVPYAALCLETNQRLLETRAWLLTIKFWLRLVFNSESSSLTSVMLSEQKSSNWFNYIEQKIQMLGIALDSLALAPVTYIYKIIKRRILDIELQALNEAARKTCSPLFLGISPSPDKLAFYFSHLINPQQRRAFMLARFNILPTAVMTGRFQKIPYAYRQCPCKQGSIETIQHVFFYCPIYDAIRAKVLNALPFKGTGYSDSCKVQFLLSNQDPDIIDIVAKFLQMSILLRELKN